MASNMKVCPDCHHYTFKDISIEAHRDASQCFDSKREWTHIIGFKSTGEWRRPKKGEWYLTSYNDPHLWDSVDSPESEGILILSVEGIVAAMSGFMIMEPIYAE